MPSFRKLSEVEKVALGSPALGARAQIAREYDAYLADYAIGDYGRAELVAGDVRSQVLRRLHAAARRRGLALRFRPGPSPVLIFHVEAAPPLVNKPTPTHAPAAVQRHDGAAKRDGASPRPSRRRQTAAERYDKLLPRWMREGQQSGRRGQSKRHTR